MKITVNGETISKEICDREILNKKREHPGLAEDQISKMAQQSIIDWTIIRQNAEKEIESVPPALVENEYSKLIEQNDGEEQFKKRYNLEDKDIPKVKQDLEKNIKINQFLKNMTSDIPEPSESEIETYYNEHSDHFSIPESIHAAHIVMQPNPANPKTSYEEMKKLRQSLLDGADFAEIADEHSSCQDQGGDLGYFSPGKMVREFDTIVFSLNVGEISPVFLTQFGYHIAKVYDKKPAEPKPLKDCRDEIIDTLKTNDGDDLIAKWVDDRKEKADIQISAE